MPRVSNTRLFGILAVILIILLGLIARQIVLHGHFAGLIVGIYLVPVVVVLSMMLGILLGLRKPTGKDEHQHKK